MDRSAVAEALGRLPSQPLTTVRILQLVEDEDGSAVDLGRLIEVDPALSTRVLRLANSPYYGLTARVASASRAVVMLGFSTVRALALSGAASLLLDGAPLTRDEFWPHAVTTAAVAAHLGRLVGVAGGDAFTAGLLHDLGRAVLHLIGTNGCHAQAGAAALEYWRFPESLVHAVAYHHDLEAARHEPLALVVHAAAGIAEMVESQLEEREPDPAPALELLGLRPAEIPRICDNVAIELVALAGFVELGA